jgi:hypothetical protein
VAFRDVSEKAPLKTAVMKYDSPKRGIHMALDFRKMAVVPDKVLFRELEGESVLLNIETETYYGLDDVGTRMWDRLIESSSVQHAYETLLADYDVSPETLKTDLTDLLERLTSQGLIALEDETPAQ